MICYYKLMQCQESNHLPSITLQNYFTSMVDGVHKTSCLEIWLVIVQVDSTTLAKQANEPKHEFKFLYRSKYFFPSHVTQLLSHDLFLLRCHPAPKCFELQLFS